MEAWYFEPAKDPKTAGDMGSSSKLWSGCTLLSALMGADQGSKKLWSVTVSDVLDDNANGVLSRNRKYKAGFDAKEPLETFVRNLVLQNLERLHPYCRNDVQYKDLERFIAGESADSSELRVLIARSAHRVLEQANWAEDWTAKTVVQAVLAAAQGRGDFVTQSQKLVEITINAAVFRDPMRTNMRELETRRLNTLLEHVFFGE